MSWGKVVWLAVVRFFGELDRRRAEAKRMKREGRLNEIKDDPNRSHAERFGDSAGRVSISRPDAGDTDKE